MTNANVPRARDEGLATCLHTAHVPSDVYNRDIHYYRVNTLLTDMRTRTRAHTHKQNLSVSDLGYHGHPEAVSG